MINGAVVYLGNPAPIELVEVFDDAGERIEVRTPIVGGDGRTVVRFPSVQDHPEPLTLLDGLTQVAHLWSSHSDAPAPSWAASSDDVLASALVDHFDCEARSVEAAGG